MNRLQLVVALVIFLVPCLAGAQTKTGSALAAELRVGGDDGLTRRFASALKSAIDQSPSFVVAEPGDENALLLTIPSNIYWHEAEGRVNFQYVVILTDRRSKYLGVSIGACWEENMTPCAEKVLFDAGTAWRSGPARQ